jgi:hypothetical protein
MPPFALSFLLLILLLLLLFPPPFLLSLFRRKIVFSGQPMSVYSTQSTGLQIASQCPQL